MKKFISLLILVLGLTSFKVSAEALQSVCTTQYDPVCGIDGKTYGNSCEAGSIGVAYKGECTTVKPIENPVDLSSCSLYYDGCNNCQIVNGQIAGCTKRACIRHDTPKCLEYIKAPVACTMDYNPVCGVDGKTYSNRCAAESSAGVTVAYVGECQVNSESVTDTVKRLTAEVSKLQARISALEAENKRLRTNVCTSPNQISDSNSIYHERFTKVYQRSAQLENDQDQLALKIMQQGADFKSIKRDLQKESSAIRQFQKVYHINAINHQKHGWTSRDFWNLIHAIAYSGVKY